MLVEQLFRSQAGILFSFSHTLRLRCYCFLLRYIDNFICLYYFIHYNFIPFDCFIYSVMIVVCFVCGGRGSSTISQNWPIKSVCFFCWMFDHSIDSFIVSWVSLQWPFFSFFYFYFNQLVEIIFHVIKKINKKIISPWQWLNETRETHNAPLKNA